MFKFNGLPRKENNFFPRSDLGQFSDEGKTTKLKQVSFLKVVVCMQELIKICLFAFDGLQYAQFAVFPGRFLLKMALTPIAYSVTVTVAETYRYFIIWTARHA